MKRYLTSYSKNRLTVRDRLTNQSASESFVDADGAIGGCGRWRRRM